MRPVKSSAHIPEKAGAFAIGQALAEEPGDEVALSVDRLFDARQRAGIDIDAQRPARLHIERDVLIENLRWLGGGAIHRRAYATAGRGIEKARMEVDPGRV